MTITNGDERSRIILQNSNSSANRNFSINLSLTQYVLNTLHFNDDKKQTEAVNHTTYNGHNVRTVSAANSLNRVTLYTVSCQTSAKIILAYRKAVANASSARVSPSLDIPKSPVIIMQYALDY